MTYTPSATAAVNEPDPTVMDALRRLRGRATLGDIVSATGMPEDAAEASLKGLLETRRGHLEVSDSGDLLYQFDPKLIGRDAEPLGARIRKAAWSGFKVAFKVWTAVMLVVYFVVFVVLIIAAMVANRDDRGGGFGGRGGFSLGDFFLMHWLLGGRGWGRGSLYYGHAHAKRLPKNAQPPFYKKVFAFIFGPEEPRPTRMQKDRGALRLIRARKGVLTSSELVEHTGLGVEEAREEMGRLTGAYGGDPRVSEGGEVVYAFPGLMKSAHGRVRATEPKPAWMRLEYPRKLTGNSAGSNAGIAAMNGFNLVAASVLGLGPALGSVSEALPASAAVFYGLGVVPFTFSSLFFAIPVLRSLGLRAENRARRRRNARRLLLGLVYNRSVGAVRWIPVAEAVRHVRRALRGQEVEPRLVLKELELLAAEFDADVEADDGGFRYRFAGLNETFVEAELMRRRLRLEDQRLGPIVYATSDTAAEASQRDGEAFDRELERADIDLSGYLPPANRVGYEEDFEVVMERPPARAPARRHRSVSHRAPPRSW